MSIGIKSFKSQTAKTVHECKDGGDLHPERRSPFAGVSLYSGKKFFKFGTATPTLKSNLFEAKPLKHVAAPPTSTNADKQKKILLKVKSVKKSLTKLFKPTGRSSTAVPCVNHPFVIPNIEFSITTDHSSLSSPSVLQNTTPSAIYYENVADASTFRGVDESSSSSSSSASWFSMETESRPNISHSTFCLGELPTIDEEDRSTREVVGVTSARQGQLANSYSGITVYLSVDTLFERSTQDESGLVNSEPRRSPAETSATSVDREDSFHSLPDASRRLRKVPSYEDLRSLQVIRRYDLPCSAMPCGFSGCQCNLRARSSSGINAAPLRRSMKCDNLRESFLLLECKPSTSSPSSQKSKHEKFWVWLSTRFDESSKDEKTSASSNRKETSKLFHGRQLLRGIFRPSSGVRAHVLKLPPRQPSHMSSPPVWSCAKITRSRSKAKERRRITKRSMKGLEARLDSMDIEPWC